MKSDIFTVIEWALAKCGYKILETGDTANSVVISHESGNENYRITVTAEEK